MEFDKNEVVTMNNSSITLYKCQNLTMNFIYSDATQVSPVISHFLEVDYNNLHICLFISGFNPVLLGCN